MKRVVIAALGLVVVCAPTAFAGAVIDNGKGVRLGVNDAGNLNFNDGTNPSNASAWGVAFDFGGATGFQDATAPACLCEGWGIQVNGTINGGANENFGGASGLVVSPLSGVTGSTATSLVELSGLAGLTVTHAYEPSSNDALFQATVTISNETGADVTGVTYRRVMDWDVPPTEFNEWVSIQGTGATALVNSHNNGFCSWDISDLSCGPIDPASLGVDYFGGPLDHGALFDFDFGALADGESVSFKIFYGAALGETAIRTALFTVGTELYSLGYSTIPDTDDGVADTSNVVYAFGFAGVGGEPIEPVPEPGTMLLLGTGLSALALRRRRKV